MWDVSDVHNDIKEHLGVVGSSLSRRIRGRGSYHQAWGSATERTSLLPDAPPPTAQSAPASSFIGYNTAEAGPSTGISHDSITGFVDLSPEIHDNNDRSINT